MLSTVSLIFITIPRISYHFNYTHIYLTVCITFHFLCISPFNHFSIDGHLVFLSFCTYKLSYTKNSCIYAFIFVLFLPIPTSEINMSKDTKIIFISSDKLPSKKTEIIYTLTNSTGTWDISKNGQICNK